MEILELPVKSIKPYKNNPRHNDKAVEFVANSLREFGWKQPIVIDEQYEIVAGHTRWKAAKMLGMETVPCVMADDLTPEQVQAYRLADNKTAEMADWDFELLEKELNDIDPAMFDMADFGFFADVEEPETEQKEIIEDEPPKLDEVEPVCKRGQIWQLGDHRLMCGDSTSNEDVESLMMGEKADLLITDPPYNVDYEGGTEEKLKILNDHMKNDDFLRFLVNAFKCADTFMKPGAGFYIWHADSEGFNFRMACRETGWTVRQCLIWNKNSLVMGRQDYQWKHEPCLYGWKDGASHHWFADRKQTTVLDFDRPLKSDIHPTMKPVKLFDYQINNSCPRGGVVLDLFGGSGTTIMACEQNGKNARLMELDPHYCDVIIKRWEDFTGKKAELLEE